MKYISIGIAVSIALALGVVTLAQQGENTKYQPCAYSSSFQSYEVLEAQSLAELKDRVQRGLDKAGWLPQGGIAYNPQTKRYLQVMVHPRKIPSYP